MSSGPLTHETSPTPVPQPPFSGPWLESLPALPAEEEDDDAPLSPAAAVRIAERSDRLGPATAGLLAGMLAGPAALFTLDTTVLEWTRREPPSLAAHALLAGQVDAALVQPLTYGAAAVAGALVGLAFALLTRHLRKFGALLVWSLVVSPAVLTCLYAFVARPYAPALLERAPYVPALVASCAFGAVLSLQLPVRRRTASPIR